MSKAKAVIVDYYYEDIQQEREVLDSLDVELLDFHCSTEEEVVSVAADCDALICQFAPITRWVIERLERCKIIVR